MVRIGIIGIGFMGWTHFAGATKIKDNRHPAGSKLKGGAVTAIATRSPAKLAGDWTSIQGNFGPPGPKLDLARLGAYDDYHALLADPDIDLVDICLPNDRHEPVVIEALGAGKHVLVEKPIAVDPKAAERMVKAADKAGRLLMVAQVLPFFPEFRFAAECIASGEYGKLRAAHFRRVIASPQWSSDMSDFRKLGGWGVDLHIHDNHFISLVCGVPTQVSSRGLLEEGFVNHVHTHYIYDDQPITISAVSGGIAADPMAFSHGFEIYLEDATLFYESGTYGGKWCADRPLTLFAGGKVRTPRLKGGGDWCAPFTAELQAAVDAVRTGQAPRGLAGDLARDALKLCYAEAKSIEKGRPVKVR